MTVRPGATESRLRSLTGESLLPSYLSVVLGCEQLYILDQRLGAQSVSPKKCLRVLDEIVTALFGPPLIDALCNLSWYPTTTDAPISGGILTNGAMQRFLQTTAHASIMRLNNTSMAKLVDLVYTGVKWQMLQCHHPTDLFQLMSNHVSAVVALARAAEFQVSHSQEQSDSTNHHASALACRARERLGRAFGQLSNYQWLSLQRAAVAFFSRRRVKVSLLLRSGKLSTAISQNTNYSSWSGRQREDGVFPISIQALPHGLACTELLVPYGCVIGLKYQSKEAGVKGQTDLEAKGPLYIVVELVAANFASYVGENMLKSQRSPQRDAPGTEEGPFIGDKPIAEGFVFGNHECEEECKKANGFSTAAPLSTRYDNRHFAFGSNMYARNFAFPPTENVVQTTALPDPGFSVHRNSLSKENCARLLEIDVAQGENLTNDLDQLACILGAELNDEEDSEFDVDMFDNDSGDTEIDSRSGSLMDKFTSPRRALGILPTVRKAEVVTQLETPAQRSSKQCNNQKPSLPTAQAPSRNGIEDIIDELFEQNSHRH
ncbi:MAG: hypothetical protein MHM6MM_005913 [Cercozoa sp. M6MM]